MANPADKKRLLKKFREEGFFLVDACEFPINKVVEKDKNKAISDNYENLKNRLKKCVSKSTKIILIKKNIHELLVEQLRADGFDVINDDFINFPSHGNQAIFKEKFYDILTKHHLITIK